MRKRRSPGGEERLLQEDTDKPKKLKADDSKPAADYVQVKSASGKTMMVERSKLARQEGARKAVEKEAPEEILLAEDSEEEEGLV